MVELDQPLLNLAAVLIAGIVGGELVGRLQLPKVTGWIGTGILLRYLEIPGLTPFHPSDPATGEAMSSGTVPLDRFLPFMHFVLGYIAFTVGAALHFAKLRNARLRLGFVMLGEALLTPLLVFLALYFVGGLSLKVSLLLGAIAIAGAPGTTVLVVQEARAKGILTRTLVAALPLIDMVAVGMFVFVSALISAEQGAFGDATLAVLYQFGATFAIGTAVVLIVLILTRTIVGPAFLGPCFVFVILASWGAADCLNLSGILACTFAGIAITNLQHDMVRSAEAYLNQIGSVLFAAFFTFAGMRLDFSKLLPLAGLVALFFLARFTGKFLSGYAAMSIAGVPKQVRNYLGASLLPHGGVAVGLILIVGENFGDQADIVDKVTNIGLAALAINQLLGPSVTRWALQRAGEAGLDRKRLLDFLDEQHIAVGIKSNDKEEVIRTLAAQLYTLTSMPITQEEFIQRVVDRENQETSCLGEGLMIPHAIIKGGDEINGILGLSTEGINFDAPDGRPVHAVLLLATPETDRSRHLEVLAAFASAITHDLNLREQLYHARSPAHAYSVLHAEEAGDLNYFLDDALERAGVFDENENN